MERRDLPEDLIEEILSRVPAKSLARMSSTSKHWNTLLKSVSFAKMHSANAPKESLIIMLMAHKVYLAKVNVASSHVKVASQFYLKNMQFISSQIFIRKVFHCDGLLLCTTNQRLVVCNPCSGETKWIKPRNKYKGCDVYALGYDNKSSYKNYKVLRLDRPGHFADDLYKEYEIYDINTDSWRVLGATIDWFLLISPGVSVKGNTYWVARNNNVPPNHLFLLSFDFSTERFEKLSFPPDSSCCLFKGLSVVREELICLCGSTDSTDLHVWVTTIKTGSVMSWSKLLNVKLAIDYDLSSGMSLLTTEQKEDVVCCQKFIHVDRHGATENSTCKSSMLLSYVPSLAQIQQDSRDL